jgi:hypothetical protein
VPLVSHLSPFYSIKGPLKRADGTPLLQLYPNPHAGLIAKRVTPNPYAPTPTEINMTNIHVLDGPLHTISAKTPGHFLKATGPANFAFAPHGLGPTDVGALPVAAQAADSDKLDGSHAADFLALHATADAALDSDKLDGSHAAAFLGATAQAADSDKLDGSHAAAFLGATAQAADSDKLDGSHAAAFLGATAQAVDSDKLDGSHAADFLTHALAQALSDFLVASGAGAFVKKTLAQTQTILRAGVATYTRNALTITLNPDWTSAGTKAHIGRMSTKAFQIADENGLVAFYVSAANDVGIRNTNPGANFDITGTVRASSTLTLTAMSSAGFVKNSAAGLLSGGNALAAADIPATLNPTAVKGAAEGATPLDIRTASATFGAGNDISLLHYQSAIQTSGAGATTILTIPIPAGTICTIEARVSAIQTTDTTKGGGLVYSGVYHNHAGNAATLIGSVIPLFAQTTYVISLSFTPSAGNVLIQAIGIAATPINWALTGTRHIVYSAAP